MGSLSQVRGEWSGRMIDGSVWIGSDADALLICRGEDRAGCEIEAVDLSVYVPLPHLRPQVLGRD